MNQADWGMRPRKEVEVFRLSKAGNRKPSKALE